MNGLHRIFLLREEINKQHWELQESYNDIKLVAYSRLQTTCFEYIENLSHPITHFTGHV